MVLTSPGSRGRVTLLTPTLAIKPNRQGGEWMLTRPGASVGCKARIHRVFCAWRPLRIELSRLPRLKILQRSHELHVRLNSRNLVFCWTNESPMMKLLRCLTLAMCMPLLADQGQAQIAP